MARRVRQKISEADARDGYRMPVPTLVCRLQSIKAQPKSTQAKLNILSFFSSIPAPTSHESEPSAQDLAPAGVVAVGPDSAAANVAMAKTNENQVQVTTLANETQREAEGETAQAESGPSQGLRCDNDDLGVEEDEEKKYGEGMDIEVEAAEEVSEWVNDVLDDAASEDLVVLEALAQEGLKKARKTHNYRSEVLFASLVDFYRWMPCQGRLRAAARVAQNLG
jgi:hypothetical protein